MDDEQYQYVEGQSRLGFPALLAEYESEGLVAVATESCAVDVRYGPLERQTFDFFEARGTPSGTLVYFHAGYWQSRDKSTFRFIAPTFTAAGLNVALVNYPLCPTVSLAELVEAVKACIAPICAHVSAAGGPAALPLLVSGHSAGAHLAVELALAEMNNAAEDFAIAGVIALSGIFDLGPLLTTTLNERLRLDPASAMANSPLHRVRPHAAPALIVVGEAETPAFIEQSRHIHHAWLDAGNRSALHVVPQADHFSLLRHFASAESPLFKHIVDMVH